MLRRLPILPAEAQWVGSVSMNDDGCERRLTILIIGDCRRLLGRLRSSASTRGPAQWRSLDNRCPVRELRTSLLPSIGVFILTITESTARLPKRLTVA